MSTNGNERRPLRNEHAERRDEHAHDAEHHQARKTRHALEKKIHVLDVAASDMMLGGSTHRNRSDFATAWNRTRRPPPTASGR